VSALKYFAALRGSFARGVSHRSEALHFAKRSDCTADLCVRRIRRKSAIKSLPDKHFTLRIVCMCDWPVYTSNNMINLFFLTALSERVREMPSFSILRSDPWCACCAPAGNSSAAAARASGSCRLARPSPGSLLIGAAGVHVGRSADLFG